MKGLCFASVILLSSLSGMLNSAEPSAQTETPLSIDDYDRQISMLKEQIAKYEGLAAAFDRKAERIQPRDFSQFRRAVSIREECKAIAEDLKKHLAVLEQERANLMKETQQPAK